MLKKRGRKGGRLLDKRCFSSRTGLPKKPNHGQRASPPPRDTFHYYGLSSKIAGVREGKWKFLEGKDEPELYNLAADIGESRSLAEAHPERVAAMRRRMEAFDRELSAAARPVGRPKP